MPNGAGNSSPAPKRRKAATYGGDDNIDLGGARPSGAKPGSQRPGGQKPDNQKPGSQRPGGQRPKPKTRPVEEELEEQDNLEDMEDDDYARAENVSKINPKVMKIAVIAGVVVVAFIGLSLLRKMSSSSSSGAASSVIEESSLADTGSTGSTSTDPSTVYDSDGNAVYNEDNSVVSDDAIDPGIKDAEDSVGRSKTTAKVYDADDTIKDLNGIDVSAVYNVASTDYVYDYVDYVAKRAIIDQGMEIYWLDATYKGLTYRIQVPYFRFRVMPESGICKVQMEVLNLEGGGKIISYMCVVSDDAGTED